MKSKRLDLTILPNRYGHRVRLLFDHAEGQREYYHLDVPDTIFTIRTLGNPLWKEDSGESQYKFIDWDGANGYSLGWEFAGWKLVDIKGIKDKGFYLGFEPI